MDNSEQYQEEGDRCVICNHYFSKARKNQKTCLDRDCRKKRKRGQEREWIRRWREEEGKSYFSGDYGRIQRWRKEHPHYQSEWRARRRREIHNAMPPADAVKPILLRLRIPLALRLSEIQTLTLRLTRTGSSFLVDGYP